MAGCNSLDSYQIRTTSVLDLTTTLVGVEFVGKVRFSIPEKTQDRILREDMKFKGIASRGAATGPRQRPFQAFMGQQQRSLGPTC